MSTIDAAPLFLDDAELVELTGRKVRRLQIEQLRTMLIPFRVNAVGRPIVTRTALIGASQQKSEPATWTPRLANR